MTALDEAFTPASEPREVKVSGLDVTSGPRRSLGGRLSAYTSYVPAAGFIPAEALT